MHHLDDFVPVKHPLRPIRVMVNAALVKMDALLGGMCEADIKGGRLMEHVRETQDAIQVQDKGIRTQKKFPQ